MKRQLIFVLVASAFVLMLSGCKAEEVSDDGRPKIICTLFPQYDFARQLYEDQADVTMLLKPGMESHMYDPTPDDMTKIANADVFIYTGDEMEPWAAEIVESLDESVKVVDLSKYVTLEAEAEHEHEHGILEAEHEHSYDPHYWLNLENAEAMVRAVASLSEELRIPKPDRVRENAEQYIKSLDTLDREFFDTVKNAEGKGIVFAGRFAYGYFVERYGLEYETVYQSCSAEADPGVADMIRVIDYIKKNGIKVIFYEELSSGRVADTIAADTGVVTREFSTAHNVSKEDFDKGVTFIDIMERNLSALREALNV